MNSPAVEVSAMRPAIPVTPPRMNAQSSAFAQAAASSFVGPKGTDLRSVTSMPSLQSFSSIQSFPHNRDYDALDFPQFDNDPMYYDLDQLQTPDLDPVSPGLYELAGQLSPQQQHPLHTPELSGSVGSGTSINATSFMAGSLPIGGSQHPQHANLIAHNIEGLGIGENGSNSQVFLSQHSQLPTHQWPPVPSPENSSSRRNKLTGAPRVVKKSSKQALKQRRSRTNLSSDAQAGALATAARSESPAPSSTLSSRSSAISLTTSPSKTQHRRSSLIEATQPANPPPISTGPEPDPQSFTSTRIDGERNSQFPMASRSTKPFMASVNRDSRADPVTPYHNSLVRARGKAGASPAMQSPMRPSQQQARGPDQRQQPRIPAAAAATALYMPLTRPPDMSRQNSMAAAAAAAAASASQQVPVTPIAERQTPRVSPSTIVLSTTAKKAGSSYTSNASRLQKSANYDGGASSVAPSPTPAARMHSSSKLVASASDSSPAKGVWQQASRAALPVSQLPKPALSPRKSASTSNLRRDTRRKQNKIIPEMSSSLNQFQVELKPKHKPSRMSLSASATHLTDKTASVKGENLTNMLSSQRPQTQSQYNFGTFSAKPVQVPHFGPVNQDYMNLRIPMQDQSGNPVGTGFAGAPLGVPADAPLAMQGSNSGQYGMADPGFPPRVVNTAIQVPPQYPQSQSTLARPPRAPTRPKTVSLPTTGHLDRVQPNGEPLQHVWASRPQPPQAKKQPAPLKRNERNSEISGQAGLVASSAGPGAQQQQQRQQPQQSSQIQQRHLFLEQQQFEIQQQYQQRIMAQGNQGNHDNMVEEPLAAPAGFSQRSNPSPTRLAPGQTNSSHNAGEDNGQDTSVTSAFMAQFINEDWDPGYADLDAPWDLMDALETPL